MEFQITTEQGETLNLSSAVPQQHQDLLLPNAHARYADGSFGALLFQRIPGDGFEILLNHYFINEPCRFAYAANPLFLQLYLVLQNTGSASLPLHGETNIRQHQFNMMYMPVINAEAGFTPGHFTSFHIHYSKCYLDKYAFMLPRLQAFLQDVEKGSPSQLYPVHPFASPEMLDVIHQLLEAGYNEALQKIYYDIKASELLFLALQAGEPTKDHNLVILTAEDEVKMHEARTWLENNLDSPLTLAEIARLIGTNEGKLKKGFKQLFKETVFCYLLRLRMEKAKQLLQQTDKPIQEIAVLTGYTSHPGFTNAFTRCFGYAPTYFRKN